MIFGISIINQIEWCIIWTYFLSKSFPSIHLRTQPKNELDGSIACMSRYLRFCHLIALNNFWKFSIMFKWRFDEIYFSDGPWGESRGSFSTKDKFKLYIIRLGLLCWFRISYYFELSLNFLWSKSLKY